MGAMLAKVSTLLIGVGSPKRPSCAGYGERRRGVPRFPSTDAMSAISSPQTQAPAPNRKATRKPNRVPADARSQQAQALSLADGCAQALDRQRVFRAHVDETFGGRARRIGRDQQAPEQAMIAVEHTAIHEGSGVTFVDVAENRRAVTAVTRVQACPPTGVVKICPGWLALRRPSA